MVRPMVLLLLLESWQVVSYLTLAKRVNTCLHCSRFWKIAKEYLCIHCSAQNSVDIGIHCSDFRGIHCSGPMYSLFAAMSSLFAAMSSLFSAMSSLFQTVSRSNLEPLNSGRGAALAWVVRRGAGHVASAYVMVGAHSFPLAVPQRLPFERVPGDTYTLGQHLG
jgi:hypothetical protein